MVPSSTAIGWKGTQISRTQWTETWCLQGIRPPWEGPVLPLGGPSMAQYGPVWPSISTATSRSGKPCVTLHPTCGNLASLWRIISFNKSVIYKLASFHRKTAELPEGIGIGSLRSAQFSQTFEAEEVIDDNQTFGPELLAIEDMTDWGGSNLFSESASR